MSKKTINELRSADLLNAVADEVKILEGRYAGCRLKGVILHLQFGEETDYQMVNTVVGIDRMQTIGLCEMVRVSALKYQRRGNTVGPSDKGE